jgi:hypothetical protein
MLSDSIRKSRGSSMKKNRIVSFWNAIIWGVAILAVAIILHWSESVTMVVAVLGGAAGASIILVSNALREG